VIPLAAERVHSRNCTSETRTYST